MDIILILCLMMACGGTAMPPEMPRYNQLGLGPPGPSSKSNMTSDKYPRLRTEETTSATSVFEYSLLGQDPKDQHWYRVSLTPKANNTAYRAQFATRKHPPFDEKLAHRHDKTIQDLLNWLDRSEDQNLWQTYRDLLEYPSLEVQSAQNDNGLESSSKEQVPKKLCNRGDHLLLVGDKGTTTSTRPTPIEGELKRRDGFVYFVKGLKPSTEPVG
ncbi:uncharacterized protein LOC110185110 isoform X1 [Drosophila serrata]|uniref:uncharacterized protein LOC110185110 isoform X1 n=1 Tax=Drosophila serrata TaxID=7274 RepID=UPI000A1D22C4|nr:uncharacterized protein LOC110185110 isoform X1 [Drosophila serrata]